MKIPFVSLNTEEKANLTKSILNEIEGIVGASQFILSERVAGFEKKFSELCGSRYAIGVNSGLDALILALRALGIGHGDEVITAPNSFVASAAAISLVGAKPVFADVSSDFNLDPIEVEKKVSTKTKAIMPVHLTGHPCQMDAISKIAEKNGLYVIEDAAQAIGAKYKERPVGSLGTVNCFSLHPLKNLHVWGDGGVITTNDQKIAERLRLERNHGLRDRDHCDFFSFNSRLDSIQAVVGLAYLELLPSITSRRQQNASYYRRQLAGLDAVKLPIVDEKNCEAVYHVFQLRVKQRDELKAFLANKGIETKVHYPIPIHLQKASEFLGYRAGDFPTAEMLAKEILSIPVRENLNKEELSYICEAIQDFY